MRHRPHLAPRAAGAFALGVAGVLALGPTLPAGATGFADAQTRGFCRTARAVADRFDRIDETDADEEVEDIDEAEFAYEQLAAEAPAQLRTPIRRIQRFLPLLSDAISGELDIDDDVEGERFAKAAIKAGKAFDKVFDYLDDRCNFEID